MQTDIKNKLYLIEYYRYSVFLLRIYSNY